MLRVVAALALAAAAAAQQVGVAYQTGTVDVVATSLVDCPPTCVNSTLYGGAAGPLGSLCYPNNPLGTDGTMCGCDTLNRTLEWPSTAGATFPFGECLGCFDGYVPDPATGNVSCVRECDVDAGVACPDYNGTCDFGYGMDFGSGCMCTGSHDGPGCRDCADGYVKSWMEASSEQECKQCPSCDHGTECYWDPVFQSPGCDCDSVPGLDLVPEIQGVPFAPYQASYWRNCVFRYGCADAFHVGPNCLSCATYVPSGCGTGHCGYDPDTSLSSLPECLCPAGSKHTTGEATIADRQTPCIPCDEGEVGDTCTPCPAECNTPAEEAAGDWTCVFNAGSDATCDCNAGFRRINVTHPEVTPGEIPAGCWSLEDAASIEAELVATHSASATPSATATISESPSATPSPTASPSSTASVSATPSVTPSLSLSRTPSVSWSSTRTPTRTPSPSWTSSRTPTRTPTQSVVAAESARSESDLALIAGGIVGGIVVLVGAVLGIVFGVRACKKRGGKYEPVPRQQPAMKARAGARLNPRTVRNRAVAVTLRVYSSE